MSARTSVVPFHLLAARIWANAAKAGEVSSFAAHAPTQGRQRGLLALRAKTPADAARIAAALSLGEVERLPDTDRYTTSNDHAGLGVKITLRAFRGVVS